MFTKNYYFKLPIVARACYFSNEGGCVSRTVSSRPAWKALPDSASKQNSKGLWTDLNSRELTQCSRDLGSAPSTTKTKTKEGKRDRHGHFHIMLKSASYFYKCYLPKLITKQFLKRLFECVSWNLVIPRRFPPIMMLNIYFKV